jgi:hypothetical protein
MPEVNEPYQDRLVFAYERVLACAKANVEIGTEGTRAQAIGMCIALETFRPDLSLNVPPAIGVARMPSGRGGARPTTARP